MPTLNGPATAARSVELRDVAVAVVDLSKGGCCILRRIENRGVIRDCFHEGELPSTVHIDAAIDFDHSA